ARPPATHLTADKTDALDPTQTPIARSRCPLASPAAYASPSPCADSTNKVCGYHESFCFTNLDLHHGLLRRPAGGFNSALLGVLGMQSLKAGQLHGIGAAKSPPGLAGKKPIQHLER